MATFVVTQWLIGADRAVANGITSVDSLQYHLPFAARFAQSGRTFDLHFLWLDPVWTFYPANAELHHAIGMVLFGGDVLSPLLNVTWVCLALLAGWVLGSRVGVGHLTLGVVALLYGAPLLASSQPGSALNDGAVLALLLSALALLAVGGSRLPVVAVAGLAAGMAAGTKVTALAPLFAVTIALVATSPRGARLKVFGAWAAAMLSTGGFWYLRNLVRVGSPLPMIDLPGLPSPHMPAVDAYGYSVAHYVGEGSFWSTYVWPGLRLMLGPTYPVLLVLGASGLLLGATALWRARRASDPAPHRTSTILFSGGLVGCTAYLFTPVTAYGPEGNPFLFFANLRYVLPGLACCLGVVALALSTRPKAWGAAVTALIGGTLVVELLSRVRRVPSALRDRPLWFAVAVLVVGAGWAVLGSQRVGPDRPRPRRAPTGIALIALTALVAIGLAVGFRAYADPYLDREHPVGRIATFGSSRHDERIAVVGYADQYLLVGADLSNEVRYLGERGSEGAFGSYRTCEAFVRALHDGGYDYLVAGTQKWGLEPPTELAWAESDPRARPLFQVKGRASDLGGSAVRTVVFEVDARGVHATGCQDAP